MRRERCFPCGLFGGGNRCRNMTIFLKHQTTILFECQKIGAKFTRRENSTLKHSLPYYGRRLLITSTQELHHAS
jgi:hypothetical protein